MNDNDFKMYWALVDELNICVKAALFLMKNAAYKEECRLLSDCCIEALISNANLLKTQIEEQIKLQFKAKRQCDTQR